MMLLLLLTELVRLDVQLSVERDGLKVDAPAGALTDELRQEALHYRIGVVSLQGGIERFYYPQMVLLAQPEEVEVSS